MIPPRSQLEAASPLLEQEQAALLSAADAAAWSLLALLCFCVLSFVLGAMVLRRRGGRHHPLDVGESKEETAPTQGDAKSTPEPPWSRDPDWWKA